MVERYSIGVGPAQLAEYFSIDPHGFDKPRFNAAPAQLLPVITINSPGLSHFYWGTAPQWAKNKPISEKIINVKLEKIEERPTISKTMKKHRCLVPADGFYGWKKLGKKSTIPYRLELKTKGLFAIAGLWEEYDDENGEMFHTFSIITRPSNKSAEVVCERMPVILDQSSQKVWIGENAEEKVLMDCLHSGADIEVTAYTVSPRINSVTVDDASLILPAPAADQFGNLTLFN